MAKTKQFTISVDNQPGAVARIAKALGDSKVNILALLGTAQGTTGSIQLVAEDAKKRSEEHTSELQSRLHLVCRLLLEKKNSYTALGPMYAYTALLTLPDVHAMPRHAGNCCSGMAGQGQYAKQRRHRLAESRVHARHRP